MIINRADRDNFEEEYHEEILGMLDLQNENGYLFQPEERTLLRFLVEERRVLLFKEAPKDGMSKSFIAEASENHIIECINQIQFVKSRQIANIISENAKLAIRDFIDQITQNSSRKIEVICQEIIRGYQGRLDKVNKNINAVVQLKADVIRLEEKIKNAEKEQIIEILQSELPRNKTQDFE